MAKFFEVHPDSDALHSGYVDGAPRWSLPGIECSVCGETWGNIGEAYPSVDLSGLPERDEFETATAGPVEQYERMRDLVRPLVPQEAPLLPGAEFGPFIAEKISGQFGDFYFLQPWWLMVKPEVLENLQAEGVRGLKGAPLEPRTKQKKNTPTLLYLEIPARGRLRPPEDRKPPCRRCRREGFTLPEALVLEGATLPKDVDLFRLENFTTVLVASERFAKAVEQLGLKDILFKELSIL